MRSLQYRSTTGMGSKIRISCQYIVYRLKSSVPSVMPNGENARGSSELKTKSERWTHQALA